LYTIKKQGQTFKGKIWEKYFDENIVRKVWEGNARRKAGWYMVLGGESWYSLEPNSRKQVLTSFLLKQYFFNHLFFSLKYWPWNFKSYCYPLACLHPIPFLSFPISVHSVSHVVYSSIVKVRTVGSSKTQVPFYQTTWHHIPKTVFWIYKLYKFDVTYFRNICIKYKILPEKNN
jgi:hypothetical protein